MSLPHITSTLPLRPLGRTGLAVSHLSFGAGPVSGLMVSDDTDRQRAVIEYAIARGINWFDTAATYGTGQSECVLGRVLSGAKGAGAIHVATKVRLLPEDMNDVRGAVRRSIEGSLQRLRTSRVTLLQIHNSITHERGDEPTSITPADVLGRGGVADIFEELQSEGLVDHLGVTGIGEPTALATVIRSCRFATLQVPYHLLNPSAGRTMPDHFSETNYGNIMAVCAQQEMGVLAIRVMAGGALAQRPPSSHTLKTPFFPLDLYERDQQRAALLQNRLGSDRNLAHEAVRFPLSHPAVSSALIGFAETSQIDEAIEALSLKSAPVDVPELYSTDSLDHSEG